MRSYLKVFLIIYIPVAIILGIGWKVSNKVTLQAESAKFHSEMENKAEILKGYHFSEEFDPQVHEKLAELSKNTNIRVTVIRKDGTVVDDSYYDLAHVKKMENHAKRPEVIEAFERGSGSSIRRSSTTEEAMNYYAVKYNDGIVLRISYPMADITAIQERLIKQNVTIYIFLFITVGLISLYLARRISNPIHQLSLVADRIEAGETKVYFPSFSDKTLTKLVSVIYRIYNSMHQKTKQLEHEKQKLNHIFGILEEGIILLDNKDAVQHFNQRASQYLGFNLKEGQNVIKQTNDMEALSFLTDVLTTTDSKRTQKSLRGRIYEVYIRVYDNEKLVAFFDITERAEYEQFKTELIGNITHELKTPLAMIMGYSETIMNDPDMDKKFHDKFINIIFSSSNRLNLLINDILKLHRLEMLREEINLEEPTNLAELKEEIEAYYSDRPQNITFESNATEVYVLREHLMSIVTNLVDNAVKYSTGDNISVSLEQSDNKITLKVEDEGPAIPIEEQQRIFERFYTMDKSKNQNSTGTGLGLSIVKHIVTLYDGKVFVKTNKKNGNTFTVVLEEKEKNQDNA
ncbi:ATP-binding protein [Seleniivibrio sp.]|uniref:HAMP domain-containing sensor histidine kinase n=1 Tax=Seleniivibrio sp. TaxID=2898801 RepID=UPI0025E29B95|nr:ATP-binding protein [Seleniivibrio sp.]MCD8553050.1 ATP-binding protein [Seleniivibrio sp.]